MAALKLKNQNFLMFQYENANDIENF
uniref:Uncharacterized protein n=1 Tax=Tetranychus urticae TaxID=32264 RepID=T1KSW9_TETUR